jgi:hypothetical protein
MNPDEFLHLAIRLASSGGEAEWRSAISRAYYGLFHVARLLVKGCGVRCPASGEVHDKVTKCLQNSGDPKLANAGNQLGSFRTFRNHADYQLDDARFKDGRLVQLQIGVAQSLHQVLSAARADTSSIRPKIRKYAKEILRMPVEADA